MASNILIMLLRYFFFQLGADAEWWKGSSEDWKKGLATRFVTTLVVKATVKSHSASRPESVAWPEKRKRYSSLKWTCSIVIGYVTRTSMKCCWQECAGENGNECLQDVSRVVHSCPVIINDVKGLQLGLPPRQESRWLINKIDVSEKWHQFKEKSLKLAKERGLFVESHTQEILYAFNFFVLLNYLWILI